MITGLLWWESTADRWIYLTNRQLYSESVKWRHPVAFAPLKWNLMQEMHAPLSVYKCTHAHTHHYNDVTWALNYWQLKCLFNKVLGMTFKKTSKPAKMTLCEGNSPVDVPYQGPPTWKPSCTYTRTHMPFMVCECIFEIVRKNETCWFHTLCHCSFSPHAH